MTTEPQAPRRHRGLAIITRLTLLFSLSALVTLGAATFLLHRTFVADLEKDDLNLLQDKVYWLRIALRNNTDYSDLLLQEVVADAEARTRGPAILFYARVLDGTGHVLVETPGMSARLPQEFFPAPMPMYRMPEQMRHWTAPNGRIYQMVAVLEPNTKGEMPARVYQVGMDDTLEETLLARYRRTSLLLVALGTIIFAAVGYFIARSALRPLRDIAWTAEHITATRLHERLQTQEWPTELVSVAESFDRMLTRLEESFARLTECSAELAHELRTPIQNLMGQTEVALSRDRSPEDYREVLQSNIEELNRLARMLNGLLFLARADDPRTHIERTPLDARRELEAVRDFHEALADALQVTITCEGNAQVFADPSLFRRAVTNLVSNALRHTRRGGTISLSVHEQDDAVIVTVQDNGGGIAPEHLPRVFERFYRTEPRELDRPEGAGLGLPIVRSIMGLHGGTAAIESTLGRGTTATLRFPLPAGASTPVVVASQATHVTRVVGAMP